MRSRRACGAGSEFSCTGGLQRAGHSQLRAIAPARLSKLRARMTGLSRRRDRETTLWRRCRGVRRRRCRIWYGCRRWRRCRRWCGWWWWRRRQALLVRREDRNRLRLEIRRIDHRRWLRRVVVAEPQRGRRDQREPDACSTGHLEARPLVRARELAATEPERAGDDAGRHGGVLRGEVAARDREHERDRDPASLPHAHP